MSLTRLIPYVAILRHVRLTRLVGARLIAGVIANGHTQCGYPSQIESHQGNCTSDSGSRV